MNVIINAEVSVEECGNYVCGTLVSPTKVSTVICHCQTSFLLISIGIKTYQRKRLF